MLTKNFIFWWNWALLRLKTSKLYVIMETRNQFFSNCVKNVEMHKKLSSRNKCLFYVKNRIYFQKHDYFTNVFYKWNNGDNITEIKYFDRLVVKLANMPSNIRVVLANDGAWWYGPFSGAWWYGPFSGAWCYGPLKGSPPGHINWIQQQAGICKKTV